VVSWNGEGKRVKGGVRKKGKGCYEEGRKKEASVDTVYTPTLKFQTVLLHL